MVLAARRSAGRDAGVGDARGLLSDRDVIAAAETIVARVTRESGRAHPVVAVCLPVSVDAVTQLVAAILGDYTICFLDPSAPLERREAILAALAPHVVVDEAGVRTTGRSDDGSPDAPGYLAMSSGSTGGAPKAVLSTWSAIAAFAGPGAEALELDATGCWGEISHPAYDMAMTNLLLALTSGAGLRVSSSLGDRLRPLRFAARARATHMRLAPRFADLAAAEQSPGHVLRVWGSGGDRFQAAHVAQLFGAGIPLIVNTYGTSETTGFASAARLSATDELRDLHGSVPIGRGAVGEWRTELTVEDDMQMLRIRSPHLPQGYRFGEPGEYPSWQSADAVLTGDVGARVGDDLYCLGRAGRRVKRNGSFADLDAIDAVLREAHGIVSFTVVTRSGELVSLVELQEEGTAAVKRDLAGLLRPDILPERLVPVRQLPRLGNGKVDHVAALALAQPDISEPAPPRPRDW
ncbi:hypothetical protein L332_08835 [Agrococcus pavilionensis RW1]|uniref:AMP-dependent synthetase/ligase domain-containing protein n=1 Tax=Agrococcus pavilionensis RW1 TaxID=1330458 RepID=U1MRH7_9MICO|nr:hypothetical protein L332_08835 [Agrococcus pavilionensis RW1]